MTDLIIDLTPALIPQQNWILFRHDIWKLIQNNLSKDTKNNVHFMQWENGAAVSLCYQ